MNIKKEEVENRIEELYAELQYCEERDEERSLLSRIKAYKVLITEGEVA